MIPFPRCSKTLNLSSISSVAILLLGLGCTKQESRLSQQGVVFERAIAELMQSMETLKALRALGYLE